MRSGYATIDEAGLAPAPGKVHLKLASDGVGLTTDLVANAIAAAEDGDVLISSADRGAYDTNGLWNLPTELRDRLHVTYRDELPEDLDLLGWAANQVTGIVEQVLEFTATHGRVPAALLVDDAQTLNPYAATGQILRRLARGELVSAATARNIPVADRGRMHELGAPIALVVAAHSRPLLGGYRYGELESRRLGGDVRWRLERTGRGHGEIDYHLVRGPDNYDGPSRFEMSLVVENGAPNRFVARDALTH